MDGSKKQIETISCPKCNNINPNGTHVCLKCGYDLATSEAEEHKVEVPVLPKKKKSFGRFILYTLPIVLCLIFVSPLLAMLAFFVLSIGYIIVDGFRANTDTVSTSNSNSTSNTISTSGNSTVSSGSTILPGCLVFLIIIFFLLGMCGIH